MKKRRTDSGRTGAFSDVRRESPPRARPDASGTEPDAGRGDWGDDESDAGWTDAATFQGEPDACAVASGEAVAPEWKTVAQPGKRLDQIWSERLKAEGVSRAKIQDWIKSGLATAAGKAVRKPNHRLDGGEALVLRGEPVRDRLAPEAGEVDVLHLDASLIVVNKPAGLVVHPAASCPERTLVQRLVRLFPELAALDPQRPGVVHRIDKDTSGLLIVARTEAARLRLAGDFAARRVDKRYLALVHGRPESDEGSIDLPIGRHPTVKTRMAVLQKGGREAKSDWNVLWSDREKTFSLLAVKIHTGRTHQIRVHLSHIGHPLLGDRTYGAAAQMALERRDPLGGRFAARQMLHAWTLKFRHPDDDRAMAFKSVPPVDFRRLPLILARRVQRVVLIGQAGSGKSTLLSMFAEAGVPVFSADRVVAGLYEPGGEGWRLIRARYGERFVPDDAKAVDKRALLAAMLETPGLRQEVVDMVHPLVHYALEDFWRVHALERVAVAEIPLFLEAGWQAGEGGAADVLLGVERACPARDACLADRGWSGEARAAVDSWQWPWPDKARRCHLLIDNPGTLDGLRERSRDALRELRRIRRAAVRRLARELAGLWD